MSSPSPQGSAAVYPGSLQVPLTPPIALVPELQKLMMLLNSLMSPKSLEDCMEIGERTLQVTQHPVFLISSPLWSLS